MRVKWSLLISISIVKLETGRKRFIPMYYFIVGHRDVLKLFIENGERYFFAKWM